MRALIRAILAAGVLVLAGAGVQAQDPMSAEELALGEKLYNTHCRACHLPGGKSRIKKLNLSDDEWKHGGSLQEVSETIAEGIEASQMQAFKNRLDADEIAVLAKYVLSFSQPAESGSR